ncbi:MAG: hypothetical protein AAGC61_01810 [Microbacterium sp.]
MSVLTPGHGRARTAGSYRSTPRSMSSATTIRQWRTIASHDPSISGSADFVFASSGAG